MLFIFRLFIIITTMKTLMLENLVSRSMRNLHQLRHVFYLHHWYVRNKSNKIFIIAFFRLYQLLCYYLIGVHCWINETLQLKYHDTGKEKDCLPRIGQWNMKNKVLHEADHIFLTLLGVYTIYIIAQQYTFEVFMHQLRW